MSGATSLREAMQFLFGRDTGAWPSDFQGTKPTSLRELLAACQDPRLAEWVNSSHGKAKNRPFSEEAQGIATDGAHWFLSNDPDDEREALRKLTWDFDVVTTLYTPFDPDKTHLGALSVRDGWVYIAVQASPWRGIWKVNTDFTQSIILKAETLPDDDMFSWCDLNPHNGLLYTCAFADVGEEPPRKLRAYRESDNPNTFISHAMSTLRVEGNSSVFVPVAENQLVRVDADIPLVEPTDDRPLARVQGGYFTPHHKWLAVSDEDGAERIQCYSTITGAFLGQRLLLADTDESPVTRNELEAICIAPLIATTGQPIQVHVLELNNEVGSPDDFYLWHFSVPDPEAL